MKLRQFALGALFVLSALPGFSDPLKDSLNNMLIFGNGMNMKVEITMEIHSDRGVKQRVLNSMISRNGDAIKFFLAIKSPAFLNTMKYLSLKDESGNENKWLATSRGVMKLSQADSNISIFDSDFTADDLSSVNTSGLTLEKGPPVKINNILCDVIDATSSDQKSKGIIHKRFYLRNNFLEGIDFLDSSGNLVKQYRVTETMLINGQIYPKECLMKNINENTYTKLIFNSIDLVDSIPSRYFNRANL